MDTLREILWQKASETLFVTKEEYFAGLDAWQIEPVEIDGELVGIVLRKGPEFHFCTTGTGRAIPMRVVRAECGKTLDEFGYLLTRTPKHEERQHRLNRRLGCVVTGEDEYDIHYRLEKIRSPACP